MDVIKGESNIPMEVDGLDKRYECPICLSCLKEPVLTSCGHRFCDSCLHAWLEKPNDCCPIDKEKLDKTKDLFPDNCTRREILSLRTICKVCNCEISVNDLDEHMLSHPVTNNSDSSDVKCPFHSIGCLMDVSKDQMAAHLELQMHHHMCLLQNSILKLVKSSQEQRSTSALSREASLWEAPGKGGIQGEEKHIQDFYKRVVVLEQRCHEQDAQIQSLKSEVASMKNKNQELSALHACGQFLWNIRQFSEKVEAMRGRDRQLYFSQGFYTSPVGYKICGRINVSPHNDDQLALLIHLMKSSHDSALKWPFNGRIHLSVIHPTNPELTVSETMMSRPELDAFKRPTREMNTKAFGYPQFISIKDITAKGYLENDTLIVKINIQCV